MKRRILVFCMVVFLLYCMIFISNAEGNFGVDLSSQFYTGSNPFYPKYYGECTWYAWGRAYEKTDTYISWKNVLTDGKYGDAWTWYENAKNARYPCGTEPRANSIAVDTSHSSTYPGHVMFVEAIDGDKMWVTEGNFSNTLYTEGYYNLSTGGYTNTLHNVTFAGGTSYTWSSRPMPSEYIYLTDIDTTAPIITNARIENRTASGYDVVVCASDNTGISWVQIGTWHSAMSIDNAVWQETRAIINGKATIHVNYSSFGNPSNVVYYTNAFAADSFGNVSEGTRCVPIEDLGEEFYATIVQESSNAYLQNQSNRIVTGYPTVK